MPLLLFVTKIGHLFTKNLKVHDLSATKSPNLYDYIFHILPFSATDGIYSFITQFDLFRGWRSLNNTINNFIERVLITFSLTKKTRDTDYK